MFSRRMVLAMESHNQPENFTLDEGIIFMSEHGYAAAAMALFVTGLAGCFLNTIVVVVIWKYNQVSKM